MSKTLLELLCEKESVEAIVATLGPCYEEYFPIEVRFNLAKWFETKLSTMPPLHDKQYCYDFAANFQHELIQEIRSYADRINENNDPDSAILKYRLYDAVERLQLKNAGDLYNHLKNILDYECTLFNAGIATTANQEHSMFEGKVSKYLLYAKNVELKFSDLVATFESYQEEVRGLNDSSGDTRMTNEDELEIAEIARNLQIGSKRDQLMEKRKCLLDSYEQFIKLSQETTNEVSFNHLEIWKQQQKKCVTGNAYVDLNKIQKWCEHIATSIRKARQQIMDFETFQQNLFSFDASFQPVSPRGIFDRINGIFLVFLKSTMIIEEQPPQVIKIDKIIKTSVRLLVGKGFIDAGQNPEVSVIIVSEENSREVAKQGSFRAEPCGELLNSSSNMAEYTSKDYRANFEKLKVTEIKRSKSRDVTDEKFALIYKTKMMIDNIEVSINLVSFPVVVIVHNNQKINAKAKIIWDSWFSEIDAVTWSNFSGKINMMFKTKTGRELSNENLHFIAEKLFNDEFPYPFPDVFANDLVTFHNFCKRKNNRQLTFWEWFYLCYKLAKKPLLDYWRDGFIEGFLSKKSIENKLNACAQGTFILRFSDSIKASISIAYVTRSIDGKPLVNHLHPYSAEDLEKKSLAEILNTFEDLKTLYPDIDKRAIFKSVQKNALTIQNGYWTPIKNYRLPRYEDSVTKANYRKK